jgi:pimeloyl-ACP methyl ester carboxylesterase
MNGYKDIWYQSADGLRLYARDYAHSEPQATILCMHGLTRNSADFAQLCEHLSDRFRVIAVDQRGRGLSQYDHDPSRYNPMVYVQDMITLLDHLALDKVVLIGTSLGGLMAMIMTSMQPQRVAGVVLNDIGPDVNPVGLERIKSYLGRSTPAADWAEAVAQVKWLLGTELPRLNDQQWLDFAHNLYRENDQGMLALAYDPAISTPLDNGNEDASAVDLWPAFTAMLSIPVLLIRGACSDILALDCVEKMQQQKPDMQYVEVTECGHAPLLNEPECVSAIDHFLSGCVLNP